jgi:cytochrome c556
MTLGCKFVRGLAVAGVLAASVALGSQAARAEDIKKQDIKKLMGENFQNVQRILVNLVTANYGTVPHDVGMIRDHVDALSKWPPATIKSREEVMMFGVYASAVRNAANSLVEVTQEIVRRDPEPQTGGELRVDYLRVSAAQYFGIMVTGCVQCHNQFRRYIVKVK